MARTRRPRARRCMSILRVGKRLNGEPAVEQCPNPAAKKSRWCEECRTRLANYDPAAEKQADETKCVPRER